MKFKFVDNCVFDRYECMKTCWSVNLDDRPNFTQLTEVFGNMLHASVTEVRTDPNSRVNKQYMLGKNAAK